MTLAVAICLYALMAVIATIKPRAGVVLIWFAIWLYPNTLLYGLLPFGIRLDDILVVYVFILCMWRGRDQIPRGTVVNLALAWMVIQLIGNIWGAFLTPYTPVTSIFKFLCKSTYVPMTAIILSYSLKTREDIKFYATWLCIAGGAAALLGIATVYFPHQLDIFFIPRNELMTNNYADTLENMDELSRRATGSIGIVATALILVNLTLLSMSRWFFDNKKLSAKLLYAVCTIVCMVGLMYTQTRGAMLAVGVAMLWGLFFSKKKSAFGYLILVGVLIALLEPGIRDVVIARFTGETGVNLAAGMNTRLGVWNVFDKKFNPLFLLSGIGMSSSQALYSITAHSTYLGALVYEGVLGLGLLVVMVVKAWSLAGRLLARTGDALIGSLGAYLRMLTIAMLVLGVSSESFQTVLGVQLFFAGMILAERVLEPTSETAPVPKEMFRLSDLRMWLRGRSIWAASKSLFRAR